MSAVRAPEPEYKYKGSYEQIARPHQEVSILLAARPRELLGSGHLLSWITGNADMHLKNAFALQQPASWVYGLTPAYDLLCTKIVMPEDTEEPRPDTQRKKKEKDSEI